MPDFPAWLPDQLELGNVLTVADNVMPFQTGYAPVGSFASISAPLGEAFSGGASFISTSGLSYLFAGGATGLYRMDGGTWATVTTGLTVPGRWRFVQFANFAVAVNGTSETYEIDLATGTAAVIAAAPGGLNVAVVGGHVFIAQPDGAMLDVAWSAQFDRSGWTPGVDQSGQETMITGGEVMGIAGGEYGVILQRERLVRVDLTGDSSAPVSFNEITTNYGCASTASIAQAGRSVFFLSDRGFMVLEDGQALRPIGNEKFDRHFRDTVKRADWETIWSAVDPRRTLVMWGAPGSPGRIWLYNWALDRATSIVTPFEALFTGYEVGTTLEGLDTLYPDGIDSIPYSLDDARFEGGSPSLYVVQGQALGLFAGDPLEARLKQGFLMPGEGSRYRCRAVWPQIDATSGVTCNMAGRQRMGDDPDAVSSGSMQESGRIPLRVAGKYFVPEFVITAGTDWNLFTGFALEGDGAGVRT